MSSVLLSQSVPIITKLFFIRYFQMSRHQLCKLVELLQELQNTSLGIITKYMLLLGNIAITIQHNYHILDPQLKMLNEQYFGLNIQNT